MESARRDRPVPNLSCDPRNTAGRSERTDSVSWAVHGGQRRSLRLGMRQALSGKEHPRPRPAHLPADPADVDSVQCCRSHSEHGEPASRPTPAFRHSSMRESTPNSENDYRGDRRFAMPGEENTVYIEDSPDLGPAPWADPRAGAAGDLESVTMKNSFTAWLAVRNIEWFNDVSRNDALIYLKHISWRCGMTVPVDVGEVIGKRAGVPSERVRHWGSGDGRGATAPDLGAAIANTANVHAQNPR